MFVNDTPTVSHGQFCMAIRHRIYPPSYLLCQIICIFVLNNLHGVLAICERLICRRKTTD